MQHPNSVYEEAFQDIESKFECPLDLGFVHGIVGHKFFEFVDGCLAVLTGMLFPDAQPLGHSYPHIVDIVAGKHVPNLV
jgi:hypothetical protein